MNEPWFVRNKDVKIEIVMSATKITSAYQHEDATITKRRTQNKNRKLKRKRP